MTKYLIAIALAFMFSAAAQASGGHGHRGHGHHKHHHHHHHDRRFYGHRYRPVERVYYREEVVRYAPPPVYYQRPYPGRPYYDRRSVEGRIGAAFGGVVGYELGRGDPLTTGVGAAVGSIIGHEIRR